MTLASNSAVWDSLDVGELQDDDSEKWASSRIHATVLLCKIFLFLSALFLLKVASISKSNGTNSPAEDLRMQALTGKAVNQFKKKINFELNKYKQKQKINKLKNNELMPSNWTKLSRWKMFPGNGAKILSVRSSRYYLFVWMRNLSASAPGRQVNN